MAPLILNLGIRRRWEFSLRPRPLYLWYSLNRRLDGLQNRTGRSGEVTQPGIEPVVIYTATSSLLQLCYCGPRYSLTIP